MKMNHAQALSIFAFLLLATMIIAGCKTTPKTDWDARVGTFTYDQAVVELGPPDKRSKLDDGQTVAEWITHRRGNGVSVGTGFGVGGVGVGVSKSVGSSRDKTLKLVFSPENKLVSWSKN